MAQTRSWFGTLNNPLKTGDEYLKTLYESGKFVFVTGQFEQKNTPHIQFYRLSAMKKICPLAHWEPVKNDQAAQKYCNKEESRIDGPWTFGKAPQNGRPKLQYAQQALSMSEEQLVQLVPHQYLQAKRICAEHAKSIKSTFSGPRKCFWLYGKPGVGKSRYVKAFGPYIKQSNKWWDGYNQEYDVLIDDLEKDSLNQLGHYLKLWGDPYGLLEGEVKGSRIALNYIQLWVTSNYRIEDMTQDPMMRDALKRRFIVIKIENDGWYTQ